MFYFEKPTDQPWYTISLGEYPNSMTIWVGRQRVLAMRMPATGQRLKPLELRVYPQSSACQAQLDEAGISGFFPVAEEQLQQAIGKGLIEVALGVAIKEKEECPFTTS